MDASTTIKFILADKNKQMIEAWKEKFSDVPNVEFHEGSITELRADCLVSPANSFGFMDGGLDMVISQNYGWHIQARVQESIKYNFDGELLVGQGLIVSTFDEETGKEQNYKYVLSAPTMRIPLLLQGQMSVSSNVYLAMKAIIKTLDKHNNKASNPTYNERYDKTNVNAITSIVIPGLGTGVGKVLPKVCADKMRMAFDDFWLDRYEYPKSLTEAIAYNKKCTSISPGHSDPYSEIKNN